MTSQAVPSVNRQQLFWLVLLSTCLLFLTCDLQPLFYSNQNTKFLHGLAQSLDVPLSPVALNSGEFWPRNSFLKHPGVIDVVIGPPILPAGQSAEALTQALDPA